MLLAWAFLMPGLGGVVVLWGRKRSLWVRLLCVALLLCAIAGLSGCGGGCPPSAHKTYTVTITGTSNATGTTQTQSTTVSFTVI